MPAGTVRYVDHDRGFGFISRDDKLPKLFLHVSEVEKAGLNSIEKGQRWIFDTAERPDGTLMAVNLGFEGV